MQQYVGRAEERGISRRVIEEMLRNLKVKMRALLQGKMPVGGKTVAFLAQEDEEAELRLRRNRHGFLIFYIRASTRKLAEGLRESLYKRMYHVITRILVPREGVPAH